jgi:DNA-damage-inducible protein D
MKTDLIKQLTGNFESAGHLADDVEFWFARDLQDLLGYTEWRNFSIVIEKAKVACRNAGQDEADHFVDVNKMIPIPKGATREIDDVMLTRYACYLIAQNGDPRKDPIAFAMSYFAIQTRKQEVLEKRIDEWERLRAREKLTHTEKELSGVLYERGVDQAGFARIRSKGDKALFGGSSTDQMKLKLGVPKTRVLADFLPTITIKAKDFATEITNFNVKKEDLKGEEPISREHVKNNQAVRKLLKDRGIQPENLPVGEDIKKLKRRVESEDKKLPKTTKKLRKRNGKK